MDERALEAAARAYLRSNTDCYGDKDIEYELPHIRAAIAAYLEASGEARDKERLDWVESQGDGKPWTARQSMTGRGFRLHNSTDFKGQATAREAIDTAMQEGK